MAAASHCDGAAGGGAASGARARGRRARVPRTLLLPRRGAARQAVGRGAPRRCVGAHVELRLRRNRGADAVRAAGLRSESLLRYTAARVCTLPSGVLPQHVPHQESLEARQARHPLRPTHRRPAAQLARQDACGPASSLECNARVDAQRLPEGGTAMAVGCGKWVHARRGVPDARPPAGRDLPIGPAGPVRAVAAAAAAAAAAHALTTAAPALAAARSGRVARERPLGLAAARVPVPDRARAAEAPVVWNERLQATKERSAAARTRPVEP